MTEQQKEKILLFDVETRNSGRANPETDKPRLLCCYSYYTNLIYFPENIKDMQNLIDSHTFLVGFNCIDYDIPVLTRAGINFEYKIIIDLFKIFKKRASAIKIKEGLLSELLMSYSLDFISKTIGIVGTEDGKIKDFDYTLLNKPVWTDEERKIIQEYAQRDIEVTKKMYEWLEAYFSGFKEFLNEHDVYTKKYLTCATAVFAYKSACKVMGIKEEYEDNAQPAKDFGGGYVAYPAGLEFSGNILLFDFSSLYPNLFIMGNLFGNNCECCNKYENEKWNGNNFFKWNGNNFFKIKGEYCTKSLSKASQMLKKFYLDRLELKKSKDVKEYAIKIIINSLYGAVANPVFKNIHNLTAAEDCTSLGRQFILYARKRFREEGYKNLLTDTDSCMIKIPDGKTKEDAQKLANKIVEELLEHMPFAWKEFQFKIDAEITNVFFFQGKEHELKDEFLDVEDIENKKLQLKKKWYLYLTTDGKLVYKGLTPKKKSCSAITRKIFREYLIPKIIAEKKVRFPKSYFEKLIKKLLEEDIKLASVRYDVKAEEEYKISSQLQAQIAKKYGAGIHFLIPNTRFGVGKDKKYCSLTEFNGLHLKYEHLELSGIWAELECFILDEKETLGNWF